MAHRVALVTDSTSGLSDPLMTRLGIVAVPLHVIFGDEELTEGVDITAEGVGERLRRASRVSTSRPSPRAFLDAYEALAGDGAEEVLSIHLSAQLSGTCDAATLAARDAPVPVRVVDSGLVGAGLGYSVLAAARALRGEGSGGDVEQAVNAALRCATSTVTLFYVHTLDFLRRGGRIGAASAFLGGALAVKPLLELAEGHIEPVEKLRTQARALARLQDIVVQRAQEMAGPPRITVHHVDAAEKAGAFAEKLVGALRSARIPSRTPQLAPLPAVLAAHVGPGALGAVVTPSDTDDM